MKNNLDISNGIFNGCIYNTSMQVESHGLSFFDKLKFERDIVKSHWELYSFFSNEPLAGEEIGYGNNYEFCYPMMCCRAQSRVILLSKNRKIVTHLVSKLNQLKEIRFNNTYISIDQLIKHLFLTPQDYIITQINANYVGHGEALNYVMLSGRNVAEADIFIKYINTFNIFRCGLRKWDSMEDLLRVSNNGSISFNYNNTEILAQIDVFFNFIKELKFLR